MAGPISTPLDELESAISGWDFTAAFPSDYPAANGVIVGHGWPYQLMSQLEKTDQGEMTEYLITILSLNPSDERVRLGSNFGAGAQPGTYRRGHRVRAPFILSCWADQRLGGLDAARKLADQVWGCVLYNENALPSYRHLVVTRTSEMFESNSQLYHVDLTVEGSLVVSVDA